MTEALVLITLGALLLAGLAMDEIGRRTRLPRVTLLVVLGMTVGPSGFDLLQPAVRDWYQLVSVMALVMVAFLLGGRLTRRMLRENGGHILVVSVAVVLATAAFVGVGLWLFGIDPVLCLVLAGISTATAPAATRDVVRRSGSSGPFPQMLLGIVAIDDAWGLIVFSLLLALAHAALGHGPAVALLTGVREIGAAILVGGAVGFPTAYLSGRLKPGEPSQAEALGVVFLCGGLSLALGASFLLAAMIAGLIVANFASHHTRAFHEIEHIEWPFMVLFFILAGASLEIDALEDVGVIGMLYLVLRIAGRIAGGWLGGRISGMPAEYSRWIGVALMPQAGVALGMALVAAGAFPSLREQILAAAVGTTILFELAGPLMTQWALANVDRNHGG
ncbi:MAG TPA: cation:proton antiporter [Afifellaceae bacterium]|nr:cation:proton antiporter [Afifellaceae bacterium]